MSERMALFLWAADRHFPQLVPGEGLVIHAGAQSWLHFLRESTDETLFLVQRRCAAWDARVAGKVEMSR